jgi:FkbM family methyltransferase
MSPGELPHRNISFSQEGEDLILRRHFETRLKTPGFYIDVGAHHPLKYSNTMLFYLLGWNGINIDAAPGSMAPFHEIRPRDINLEVGVAEQEATLTFNVFADPGLSGFDGDLIEDRKRRGLSIVRQTPVQARPLRAILAEHLPPGRPVSFLTIDAEGLDLAVLRSNDWKTCRPEVVVAEQVEFSLYAIDQSPLAQFMHGVGYGLRYKTFNSVFFVRG